MGTAVKIPTLKGELINIQNNPEQRRLYYIIEQLKDAAMTGINHLYIDKYTENIKNYLEEQGLNVKENDRYPMSILVTWK